MHRNTWIRAGGRSTVLLVLITLLLSAGSAAGGLTLRHTVQGLSAPAAGDAGGGSGDEGAGEPQAPEPEPSGAAVARALTTLSPDGMILGVVADGTGGYIGVGKRNGDGWIIRVDENLALVDELLLDGGGTGGDGDELRAVASGGGSFAAVGYLRGASDEGWVVTFDVTPDGDLSLSGQRTVGGANVDRFNAIASDGGGGWVAAGYQGSVSNGGNDGWLVGFDSGLNVTANRHVGGSASDVLTGVVPVASGYVLSGYTSTAATNFFDGWIVRTDASLVVTAQRRLRGGGVDIPTAIAGSGPFVMTGRSSTGSTGGSDGMLVLFDEALTLSVNKAIGGGSGDRLDSAAVLDNGNFALAGEIDGIQSWVVEITPAGEVVKELRLGMANGRDFQGVAPDGAGGILAAGGASGSVFLGIDGQRTVATEFGSHSDVTMSEPVSVVSEVGSAYTEEDPAFSDGAVGAAMVSSVAVTTTVSDASAATTSTY